MTDCIKLYTKLEKHFQKAYILIFGQCNDHMLSKLESHKDYQNMRGYYNVLLLLVDTKGLTFKFDIHKHLPHALHDTRRDLYRYYQTGQTKNRQYLESFKKNIAIVYSYVRATGTDPGLDN